MKHRRALSIILSTPLFFYYYRIPTKALARKITQAESQGQRQNSDNNEENPRFSG
jgi:hypothetical protein